MYFQRTWGKNPGRQKFKRFLNSGREGRFKNPAIDLFVKKVETMFLPIYRLELLTDFKYIPMYLIKNSQI